MSSSWFSLFSFKAAAAISAPPPPTPLPTSHVQPGMRTGPLPSGRPLLSVDDSDSEGDSPPRAAMVVELPKRTYSSEHPRKMARTMDMQHTHPTQAPLAVNEANSSNSISSSPLQAGGKMWGAPFSFLSTVAAGALASATAVVASLKKTPPQPQQQLYERQQQHQQQQMSFSPSPHVVAHKAGRGDAVGSSAQQGTGTAAMGKLDAIDISSPSPARVPSSSSTEPAQSTSPLLLSSSMSPLVSPVPSTPLGRASNASLSDETPSSFPSWHHHAPAANLVLVEGSTPAASQPRSSIVPSSPSAPSSLPPGSSSSTPFSSSGKLGSISSPADSNSSSVSSVTASSSMSTSFSSSPVPASPFSPRTQGSLKQPEHQQMQQHQQHQSLHQGQQEQQQWQLLPRKANLQLKRTRSDADAEDSDDSDSGPASSASPPSSPASTSSADSDSSLDQLLAAIEEASGKSDPQPREVDNADDSDDNCEDSLASAPSTTATSCATTTTTATASGTGLSSAAGSGEARTEVVARALADTTSSSDRVLEDEADDMHVDGGSVTAVHSMPPKSTLAPGRGPATGHGAAGYDAVEMSEDDEPMAQDGVAEIARSTGSRQHQQEQHESHLQHQDQHEKDEKQPRAHCSDDEEECVEVVGVKLGETAAVRISPIHAACDTAADPASSSVPAASFTATSVITTTTTASTTSTIVNLATSADLAQCETSPTASADCAPSSMSSSSVPVLVPALLSPHFTSATAIDFSISTLEPTATPSPSAPASSSVVLPRTIPDSIPVSNTFSVMPGSAGMPPHVSPPRPPPVSLVNASSIFGTKTSLPFSFPSPSVLQFKMNEHLLVHTPPYSLTASSDPSPLSNSAREGQHTPTFTPPPAQSTFSAHASPLAATPSSFISSSALFDNKAQHSQSPLTTSAPVSLAAAHLSSTSVTAEDPIRELPQPILTNSTTTTTTVSDDHHLASPLAVPEHRPISTSPAKTLACSSNSLRLVFEQDTAVPKVPSPTMVPSASSENGSSNVEASQSTSFSSSSDSGMASNHQCSSVSMPSTAGVTDVSGVHVSDVVPSVSDASQEQQPIPMSTDSLSSSASASAPASIPAFTQPPASVTDTMPPSTFSSSSSTKNPATTCNAPKAVVSNLKNIVSLDQSSALAPLARVTSTAAALHLNEAHPTPNIAMCTQTMRVDDAYVMDVALSPDGRYLAAACYNGIVSVWIRSSAKSAQGHAGGAGAAASTSASQRPERLGRSPWVAHRMLRGHGDKVVWAVAFSPDGRYLLSAGFDRTVRAWPLAEWEQLPASSSSSATGPAAAAATSARKNASSGGQSQSVPSSSPSSAQSPPSIVLKGHASVVNAIDVSSDSLYAASGSADRTIRVWQLPAVPRASHRTVKSSNGPAPAGGAAAASGGNAEASSRSRHAAISTVAAAGGAGATGGKAASLQPWPCVAVLKGHTNNVVCLAFSPDATTLVSGSRDATVRVWKLEPDTRGRKWDCVGVLTGHGSEVTGLAFAPSGAFFVSVGQDEETARVWKYNKALASTVLTAAAVPSQAKKPQQIAESDEQTDDDEGATEEKDLAISVNESEGCPAIYSASDPTAVSLPPSATAVSLPPSAATLTALPSANSITAKIASLASSAKSGSADGAEEHRPTLPSPWECVRVLRECRTTVTVTADSRYIITAGPEANSSSGSSSMRDSGSGMGDVGSASAGGSRRQSSSDNASTSAAANSSSRGTRDTRSATTAASGTTSSAGKRGASTLPQSSRSQSPTKSSPPLIKVWHADTGECMRELAGHTGPVFSVAVSRDGRMLVSGGFDASVKVWV